MGVGGSTPFRRYIWHQACTGLERLCLKALPMTLLVTPQPSSPRQASALCAFSVKLAVQPWRCRIRVPHILARCGLDQPSHSHSGLWRRQVRSSSLLITPQPTAQADSIHSCATTVLPAHIRCSSRQPHSAGCRSARESPNCDSGCGRIALLFPPILSPGQITRLRWLERPTPYQA